MPELILGQFGKELLTYPGSELLACYAPTRTGKGVSFVIPNLLKWPDSVICLDIKRENWRATSGAREAMGQDVYLFDPLSPTGETHRYNPFSFIDRGSPDAFNQIQRLGTTIFPEPASDNARFWTDSARSAWTGVAAYVAETPALPFTMAAVFNFFVMANAAEVLKKNVDDAREAGHPYTLACVQSLSDYISCADSGRTDLYQSIRKSVSTRLGLWQNARICAATSDSDFDLRELRSERISIYVAVSPADIELLQPLLAIFFQQIVNLTCRTLPEDDPAVTHSALLLLDEFAALGAIPHLAKASAFMAGYWLRMALVIQDPPQLDGVYGRDIAKTIFDNCGCELAFGTKGQELTESLSKRFGTDTVRSVTEHSPKWWKAFQWNKQTQGSQPFGRALLLPQEVARMPDTEALVIRRGCKPIKVRKLRWYEDQFFYRQYLHAPDVPRIEIITPMDDGSGSRGKGSSAQRSLRTDQLEMVLEVPRSR